MSTIRTIVALIATLLVAACAVEEPAIPPVSGPSEFGLSVTLSATPDQLPRDGTSQSVVRVTVRDASGNPVAGQRLTVAASPGSVSQSQIVTDTAGLASFAFVAPSPGTLGNIALVEVTPIGNDFGNAAARRLVINLTGVSNRLAPTASFTFSPSAPTLRDTVTFDASASTDESPNVRCLDLCTYAWNFGGEATASGRIVTYQFQSVRTFAVTLTVTDGAGASGTSTQNVAVTAGTAPTASIAFSPSSPAIFETVSFTGEASAVGQAGRTIVNHQWQFGDGTNGSGLRVTKTYDKTGTFTVVLTVTDSAGVQGTTTKDVAVVAGITADFTISPTAPAINQTIIFNAEASKGSTGFGGRNAITKYIWNFGASTSTTETTTPRTSTSYSVAATYTVVLTVEDSAGRRATTSNTVTVK